MADYITFASPYVMRKSKMKILFVISFSRFEFCSPIRQCRFCMDYSVLIITILKVEPHRLCKCKYIWLFAKLIRKIYHKYIQYRRIQSVQPKNCGDLLSAAAAAAFIGRKKQSINQMLPEGFYTFVDGLIQAFKCVSDLVYKSATRYHTVFFLFPLRSHFSFVSV